MLLRTFAVFCMIMPALAGFSQSSFWFGPRVGGDINFQRWDGSEANSLVTSHFGFFLESFEEDQPSSFYANLSYHTRGAAINYTFLNGFQNNAYRFNNIVLGIGAKRKIDISRTLIPYYIVGARAEYTIGTNLSDYQNIQNAVIHPSDAFVQKFNYGITIGGGFEKRLSDFVECYLEFAIQPDLSFQYRQPPLQNIVVTRFNNTSDRINLPERNIRNVSFEITLGFKFLRLVEYEDY